jgi:hypothetical protein
MIINKNETLNDNYHCYNTFNDFCWYPVLKEIQENTTPAMACERLVKKNKN